MGGGMKGGGLSEVGVWGARRWDVHGGRQAQRGGWLCVVLAAPQVDVKFIHDVTVDVSAILNV